jgi:hypothetical protein
MVAEEEVLPFRGRPETIRRIGGGNRDQHLVRLVEDEYLSFRQTDGARRCGRGAGQGGAARRRLERA